MEKDLSQARINMLKHLIDHQEQEIERINKMADSQADTIMRLVYFSYATLGIISILSIVLIDFMTKN
jgi:hypothetical protein